MKKLMMLAVIMIATGSYVNAQISGAVFKDFNANGVKDANEPFAGGVIVNAYNSAEVLVASATTTAPLTGTTNYSLGVSVYPVRVEYVIPATGALCVSSTYDLTGYNASVYGSNVKFITATTTTANFALNNPAEYVKSTNPYFFAVLHISGDPTGTAGTATTTTSIMAIPYQANNTAVGATTPATRTLAASYTGSVYGLAYSKQSGKLFAGAYMKRHVGLGTLGSGGIYMIDSSLSTASVTSFYNLDAAGFPTRSNSAAGAPAYGAGTSYTVPTNITLTYPGTTDPVSGLPLGQCVVGTNAQRGLTSSTATASNDPAAYGQVGIVGLGDLEMGEGGNTLYTVNLYDRKLYKLTLNSNTAPTAVSAATGYALPAPPLRSTLGGGYAVTYAGDNSQFYDGTKGFLRPFAIKSYRGKIYVGAVTTGEGTGAATTTDDNTGNPEYTDLWAYVFVFDPATNTWASAPALQFPLNFERGTNGDAYNETFRLWKNTSFNTGFTWNNATTIRMFYAQAMLTDIAFDPEDGSMILGFRDRVGDQLGHFQYKLSGTEQEVSTSMGDILRAYRTSSCTFELESAGKEGASSLKAATGGAAQAQGPGGGEFYYQDNVFDGNTNTFVANWHLNTTEGSVFCLPGTGHVASTSMDPANAWQQGVDWFSNTAGTNVRNHIVEQTSGSAIGGAGKASGMGDIECIRYDAPLEVGNYLWKDANGDGIQNANETGIANVTLELFADFNNDGVPDGAALATINTSAAGQWFFNESNVTDGDPVTAGNQPGLKINSTYLVRVASSDWNSTTGLGVADLLGYRLTSYQKTSVGLAGASDNDAQITSGATIVPQISFTTGGKGFSNLNLDFGFKTLPSLGDRVWLDNGAGGGTAGDGVQNGTEPGVAGITVMLYRNGADGLPGTADDVLVGATITDAYGNYLFDNLTETVQTNAATIAQTSYNVRVTPPANYSFSTQTNTTDDDNTTGASLTGSDVNPLGVSYSINLSSGEVNMKIDAGLIFRTETIPNSIGDRVWFDTNGDGVQDAGEPGVSGITVTLYDNATGNILGVTTTDASGNYIFNNLPLGTYRVGVSAPGGAILSPFTSTTPGNATTNSDINPATGSSTAITISVQGTQIAGIDAGIRNDPKGSLGDFVWNDLNKNGIQDANEPGIQGVTMQLYSPGPNGVIDGTDDVLLATTTTDATGYYVFTGLDPVRYFVVATPVAGYTLTLKDVTSGNPAGDTKDNDFAAGAAPYTGKWISPVRLLTSTGGSVARDMTVDLGMYNSTLNLNSLGDFVWNDINNNGIQDAGEPGAANITVRLYNGSGTAVNNPATGKPYVVFTDMNGFYRFSDLADGTYIVEFANLPAGYSFTASDAAGSGAPGSGTDGTTDSDVKTSTGRTAAISLDAGSISAVSVNITSVDAGIRQGTDAGTATLGNRVWYDINNNGLQDATETGVAGVKVELLDGANAAVDSDPNTAGVQAYTVYTNALGEYLFTGLAAGDYKVRFSNFPAGYTSSAADQGTDDAKDADANFAGTSVTAATTATTAAYTLQAGEDNYTVDMGIVPASGTNRIGDFVWNDANRNGLQDAGERGVQGIWVSLYTNGTDGIAGTPDDVYVTSTATDSTGRYAFVGLADGNYNVGFSSLPAGFDFTAKDAAGFTAANGSDAVIPTGRTGTIALDPASATATAVVNNDIDAGIFTTRAALGDYVWMDTNGDGVQDATEKGISGVTATLYASDGTTVLASAITDAYGTYYFGNLTAGSYVVGFSSTPAGLSFTTQVSAGDNGNYTNSDASPATGKTGIFVLSASEIDLTADAGLKPDNFASVGDYVWNDIDQNGVQGATEPGVPGVLVTLYDVSNNIAGTAVTNGSGRYLISKVPAGSGYYIIFSNLPASASFTTQTSNVTAGDATLGSDPNAAGRTAAFTLTAGQYLPTVDAGLRNVSVVPVKLISFTAVPDGNKVRLDWAMNEQQDAATYDAETGTNGITFNKFATVQANNAASAAYDTYHLSPAAGVNYYRIKITDKDGRISYTDVRKVNFGKAGLVTVYPNPASDHVFVTLTGSMTGKATTISIFNAAGSLISQQHVAAAGQTEMLDVSRLPSGSYVIKVMTQTETVSREIQVVR